MLHAQVPAVPRQHHAAAAGATHLQQEVMEVGGQGRGAGGTEEASVSAIEVKQVLL